MIFLFKLNVQNHEKHLKKGLSWAMVYHSKDDRQTPTSYER